MIVSISNLKVIFHNGCEAFTVIDIPSWSVNAGDQVAISGQSGSGKSTFLHVLAGLLKPDSGSINVCGQELTELPESGRDRLRAVSIGYIFQNFNLLQGYTALENVLLGMTFSDMIPDRKAAGKILSDMGLGHRLNQYPAKLSIGEQQRVAIARALIKKPALILADEPTGSLDPLNTLEVIGRLQSACREYGCTLIMVSHEPDVVSSFESNISFLDLNMAFKKKGGRM